MPPLLPWNEIQIIATYNIFLKSLIFLTYHIKENQRQVVHNKVLCISVGKHLGTTTLKNIKQSDTWTSTQNHGKFHSYRCRWTQVCLNGYSYCPQWWDASKTLNNCWWFTVVMLQENSVLIKTVKCLKSVFRLGSDHYEQVYHLHEHQAECLLFMKGVGQCLHKRGCPAPCKMSGIPKLCTLKATSVLQSMWHCDDLSQRRRSPREGASAHPPSWGLDRLGSSLPHWPQAGPGISYSSFWHLAFLHLRKWGQ